MVKVEIMPSLLEEIRKKFKKQGVEVLKHLRSLEESPNKGKLVGVVGGIVVKELKYKGFRFYFITDGYTLRVFDEYSLTETLLRFVRMSDKKHQKETIKEIKAVLRTMGDFR